MRCLRLFEFTDSVSGLLKAFREDLDTLTRLYPDAGLKHKQRTVNCLAEIWKPTIAELRRMRVGDPAVRNKMTTQWQVLGRAFGLTDSSQGVPIYTDTMEYDIHYERKNCHLSSCICHTYAGAHEMRVCKGCWKVFYCTTKCQAAYVLLSWDATP